MKLVFKIHDRKKIVGIMYWSFLVETKSYLSYLGKISHLHYTLTPECNFKSSGF